ncbi:MAG: type II toxin-antitoxin system RelE/ParE family toxin [Verrucomicrobiaceae bacterium]|jgi:plasmid stabilization system protein ParE
MVNILLSAAAAEDIALQMSWYQLRADETVAARYELALRETFLIIAQNPSLGRIMQFKAAELEGIRRFPASAPFHWHLVFYRADDSAIHIERVLHGVRDLPCRLVEPPGSD